MSAAEHLGRNPSLAVAPAPDRVPWGFVGVLAPMNSLGFAPAASLGIVYEGALLLAPAAAYQISFSFQQKRIVDELLATPFAEAAEGRDVRVYRASDIADARLVRQPVLGWRLTLTLAGSPEAAGPEVRFIVQRGDLERLHIQLSRLLGERFVDEVAG